MSDEIETLISQIDGLLPDNTSVEAHTRRPFWYAIKQGNRTITTSPMLTKGGLLHELRGMCSILEAMQPVSGEAVQS